MTSTVQHPTWTGTQAVLVFIAIFLLAGFCFGQPTILLSPSSGPPTTSLRVSGSGFAPYAKIDLYFGTQDEAVAVANRSGSFSQIAIPAPASALPGTHWVSAVERSGREHAQVQFEVRTGWNQFHRPDMMRWNPYENVLNVNNVGSLQVKWTFKTRKNGQLDSSPAVSDGVVYVGGGYLVYALNAKTGAKLWSYRTGGPVTSSPAVANGVVYVGANVGHTDESNVYALKADTGALLWTCKHVGVSYSPTVANGVVYVGSDDHNVYALNASTGAKLWSYATGSRVETSPAVVSGVVYVGSFDENVYALNAKTGALLWSYVTGGAVTSSPAVASGVVYFGSDDGNVYALNAKTGAKLWSYATACCGAETTAPAVANGVVYAGSGDNLYALNAITGAELWTCLIYGNSDSPAVANGVVYVSEFDGDPQNTETLYAINASTGAILWSYTGPPRAQWASSPAVVNGVVYVGLTGGYDQYAKVYAFGLKKDQGKSEADSKRPGLNNLHPDLSLKVSQPVATPAGAD